MTTENKTPNYLALAGAAIGAAIAGRHAYRTMPKFRAAAIGAASTVKEAMVGAGQALRTAREFTQQYTSGAGVVRAREFLGLARQRAIEPYLINPRLFQDISEINVVQYSGQAKQSLAAALSPTYGPKAAAEIATQNYRALTVGDILDSAAREGDYYRLSGKRFMRRADYGKLQMAVQNNVISRDFMVDRHLLVQQGASGLTIRDSSLLSPRDLAAGMLERLQKFQYMGASPVDVLMPEAWKRPVAAGRVSPHIPIRLNNGQVVRPGGDFGMVVGGEVYRVTGSQFEHLGRTNAVLRGGPKSKSIVFHHAAQQGLAGKRLQADGIRDFMSMAERKGAFPGRYEGLIGRARGAIERGFGVKLPWLGRIGIGEGLPLGTQYARHPSLPGMLAQWWENRLKDHVPYNVATGKYGGRAFEGAGPLWKAMGKLGATPPGMENKLLWLAKDRAESISRAEAKTMLQAVRPMDLPMTMKGMAGQIQDVQYAAMTGGEFASAIGRRFATVPFATMEYATGLGVKPGKAHQMMWDFFAKGVIPAWLGWEAIKYVDYMAEQALGIGPIKGMTYGYAAAQTAGQAALNLTGYSLMSRGANAVTGGFFNTPAGTMLRVGGTLAAGFGVRKIAPGAAGRAAPWIALGAAALQFTTTPEKPASQLWQEYMGEREVPIRRGRWWMGGAMPFGGGEVMYYRQHRVAQILEDADYEKYGGKADYFKHISLLPTPHSLMGLRRIADPYSWEYENYYDKPYPVSRGMFSDVPLAGPLLNLTAGQVIKPRKLMHQEELRQWLATPTPYMGEPGLEGLAEQLGVPIPPTVKQVPRYTAWQDLGLAIDSATDYIGLGGFMIRAGKQHMTGKSTFFMDGPVLETPDYPISQAKTYYDMQLGGLFGMTEFYRRLIPRRPYETDWVNPIPNTMPNWLPGSRSEFGDTGFIDFHVGDPESKIAFGASRLPAPGEQYSGVDQAVYRWKTLEGIAPFASATDYYKTQVFSALQAGDISDRQMNKLEEIQERMPMWNMSTAISGKMGFGSGVASELPHIPFVSAKLLGHRNAIDAYRAYVLQGSDFQDWKDPYAQMFDPYFAHLSSQSVPEAVAGGAALGLLGRTSGARGGLAMVGAGLGALQSLRGPVRSQKEQDREYFEEYFDKLRYLKFRTLEERAISMGRGDLANKLRGMQGRTMAGLNYSQDDAAFYGQAYRALPKKDRDFLLALSADPSMEIAELPSYMRPMVEKLRGDQPDRSRRSQQEWVDSQTIDWMMESGGIPGPEWEGWSPSVSTKHVKAMSFADKGRNVHEVGAFESSLARSAGMMPTIHPLNINPGLFGASRRRYSIHQTAAEIGIDNPNVMVMPTLGGPTMNMDINRDRSSEAYNWMNRGRW